MSLRKLYEKETGILIPHGMELHHIVPKHAGGTDDISNLEMVTREEHIERHQRRYEEFGDFRDLCAMHMIGYNFTEAHKVSSSEGGRLGGLRAKELGVGIFTDDEEQRRQWASQGGKAAQKTLREQKLSSFYNPKQHAIAAQKGRDAAKEKGAGFHDSELQRELGRRGGPKNKGFKWYTDGTNNYKYTSRQQEKVPLEDFLEQNEQFRKGCAPRETVECPHCGKRGQKPSMYRHHFNNCKKRIINENQDN